MTSLVYIALGSNVGDRAAQCAQAVNVLRDQPQLQVHATSPLFEYPALLKPASAPQPAYLNGVVALITDVPAETVLALLETTERTMGRTSKSDWAARTIDLDLLLYGDQVLATPRLTIPHPALHTRRFVLEPLATLAPDLVIPGLNRTVQELLETL